MTNTKTPTFSLATVTHMLNSDEFNELVRSGAIGYLQESDNTIVLTYSHKGYCVVLTNRIKEVEQTS